MSESAAQRTQAPQTYRLEVVPERRGTWRIDHGRTALSRHDDKQAAVAEARRLAEANQPSHLTVYDELGQVETERPYRPAVRTGNGPGTSTGKGR